MRKIGWLFIVIFLFINNSYGQTKQDSITSFKKVNKWAVVKLTIAYMEDLRGWPKKNAKKNQELETYNKLKTNYDSYLGNIDLEAVSNLLLKGWGKTRDGVFQNYKKELVDSSITANNFEKIYFVPEKASPNKRSEAIKEIKAKYSSFLPKQEKETKKVEEATFETEPSKVVTTNKEKTSLLNIVVYIALVISLLIILFLIIVLKKAFKEVDDLKEEGRKRAKGIQVDYNTESKTNETIDSLKRKNDSLEKQIEVLTNKLYSPKNSLKTDLEEQPVEDKKSLPRGLSIAKKKQAITRLIYFPSPFEDNRFSNEDVSETQVPFSLYVAEIEGNTNRGSISLIEKADLSRALNSPNTFLEPVCNYENAYSSSTKEIKVIAKGDVVLEGEDWVVKTKIRIKFI